MKFTKNKAVTPTRIGLAIIVVVIFVVAGADSLKLQRAIMRFNRASAQ